MNIQEDYVSFETAKLLKEKGFDEYCYKFYDYNDKKIYREELPCCNSRSDDYAAPTLQMVMKWLREVHKLYINIWADPKDIENNDFNTIFRSQVYDGYSNCGIWDFSTYEEACEYAIKYCLENLI